MDEFLPGNLSKLGPDIPIRKLCLQSNCYSGCSRVLDEIGHVQGGMAVDSIVLENGTLSILVELNSDQGVLT